MAGNISEQSKIEALTDELNASKALLAAILNSTYYGIANYAAIRSDSGTITDFRIVFTNAEVPGNFGKKVENVIHKTCREVYPGIFENGIFKKMVHVIATGISETYEISVFENGQTIWLAAAIEKVGDSVTVTSKNITSEKESALHLEKVNALLEKKEALLEQKNSKLQSQNEELASFNYIASHDLQEPLRKIRIFTGRILELESGNLKEASQGYFENIGKTAERMQNLINDLLAYSGMDSENLKMKETDLNLILRQVFTAIEDISETKNVKFKFDYLPVIHGIPPLLEQLFSNIIINAIKYSKEGIAPEVSVSYELSQIENRKYHKIVVTDNGIGFEAKYKDKIFEVFQRLQGKKEYSGTGVGLAICKKIMQYHNGLIAADGNPGKGAVFTVFFPVNHP
ncbi:hypothetical protein FNO01nite_20500 [Flavobacterium noncentrifugens]|uniref:histidine kinase n=1 Tax=Flavobacterium noncentrifugens TaxID=1128970 RepID=A0A1G8YVS5_9FLAO|nr:ATP-binding protein [Flavobacterium noncentrifugens]GEP51378.1 hypothetical protein FNO01nite_20500 [Flavobacterium noncentrifugens]SDK06881.1 His Kinase A (phospho-acceptor) domain-containing protein [Flavobacterium noncentrifugens]